MRISSAFCLLVRPINRGRLVRIMVGTKPRLFGSPSRTGIAIMIGPNNATSGGHRLARLQHYVKLDKTNTLPGGLWWRGKARSIRTVYLELRSLPRVNSTPSREETVVGVLRSKFFGRGKSNQTKSCTDTEGGSATELEDQSLD